MGKPLMLQSEDHARLERLKRKLKAKSKVQVLRGALDELEKKTDYQEKVRKWKMAASLVAKQSAKVTKEFQSRSLLKRHD